MVQMVLPADRLVLNYFAASSSPSLPSEEVYFLLKFVQINVLPKIDLDFQDQRRSCPQSQLGHLNQLQSPVCHF